MTIIRGMALADYHASPEVSNSKLRDFDVSPLLYHQRYVTKTLTEDEDEKKAYVLGRVFEAMVCDANAVKMPLNSPIVIRDSEDAEYVVKPEGIDFRTKDGKAWREANANRSIITNSEYEQLDAMRHALQDHDCAMAMLDECEQQVTFRAEVGGVAIQSRPDLVCLNGSAFSEFRPYTMDIKTCENLDRILNGRAVVDFGYHTQAEMAGQCLKQNGFDYPLHFLCVVEKSIAHRATILEIEPAFLAHAASWLYVKLIELDECMRTGHWPRFRPGIQRLAKPAWLKEEQDT